jgi:hypothetical protein
MPEVSGRNLALDSQEQDPADAITDAGTALQAALKAVGAKGPRTAHRVGARKGLAGSTRWRAC